MSMHSRPNRRGESRRVAFVEQAVAQEMVQLHCKIPDELHLRLRVMAAEERLRRSRLRLFCWRGLLVHTAYQCREVQSLQY